MATSVIFQKWWDKDTKQFSISWLRPWWSKNGVGQIWEYRTNGASKNRPTDTCLDVTLILGYLVLNYTNWKYQ